MASFSSVVDTIPSDNDERDELFGGPPTNGASAAARIAEIRTLLHGLDATPHTQMTPFYYQHGFNEFDLAVRDLLHIIDTGLVPASVYPSGRGRSKTQGARTCTSSSAHS